MDHTARILKDVKDAVEDAVLHTSPLDDRAWVLEASKQAVNIRICGDNVFISVRDAAKALSLGRLAKKNIHVLVKAHCPDCAGKSLLVEVGQFVRMVKSTGCFLPESVAAADTTDKVIYFLVSRWCKGIGQLEGVCRSFVKCGIDYNPGEMVHPNTIPLADMVDELATRVQMLKGAITQHQRP
jgi:hypothetical protein